jgi:cytochrome o ubiquinol oxidase operon protein cyoD
MLREAQVNETGAGRGTLGTYVTGFVLSLLLTGTAYGLVWDHVHSRHEVFSHHFLMAAVLGLAVLQLLVQLVFFLHMSRESKPRWNVLVLLFATGVVLIVVLGSLWIMDHLNYRMMSSPSEVNKYIQSQGGSDI